MARGRMLNNSVSLSMKFNRLSDDTCRLLATWTISHLDKNGVFYGEPVTVKSVVFPHRADIDVVQIGEYLREMVGVGLIRLFTVDGMTWQYWPGFAGEQVGLRADRESTNFPAPPGPTSDNGSEPPSIPPVSDNPPDSSRNDTGKKPEQNPHKEKFKGESEGESESVGLESARADAHETEGVRTGAEFSEGQRQVSMCWEGNFAGTINQDVADNIKAWLTEHSPEFLCDCIREAKRSSKQQIRSPVAYVQKVIDRRCQEIHPAVVVYCQKAQRRTPVAEIALMIADAVGHDPEDLNFWGQVIVAYVAIGWNRDNILNMLTYFEQRKIPRLNQNGSGKNGAHQTGIRGLQEKYGDQKVRKRVNRKTGETYYVDTITGERVAAPAGG